MVNRERCEARAREWRKLPARDGADILRKDRVSRPPDFDTVLEVGIVAPPARTTGSAAPLEGFAMAYGGWLHKCFAWVYATRATGPGAERLVGARLAAMADGSLGGIELDSDLSPRIPREPVGPSPRR